MISTNQGRIQLPTATNMAEFEEETVPSILLPCSSCNRTFRPEALNKHVKYCEKTLIKKRKVFDSAKQRIQGTELAEFLPVITHKKKEKSPIRKTQSKWKEKHMELVRAIRAARTGPSEDLPPAPSKPCDHEKCPHCDRYFGPKAYDRHLEWCKEHSSRIQPKSPASLQAKERLEARIKYRAPVLAKSRRAVVREKYQQSGNLIRDPSPMGKSPKNISSRLRDPSPAERLQKNAHDSYKQSEGPTKGDLNTINALSRQQPLRSSRRNPSPMKKTSTSVKSRNSETKMNVLSPKEKSGAVKTSSNVDNSILLQEVNVNTSGEQNEDIFMASCNISSVKPGTGPSRKMKGTNNSLVPNHNNSIPNRTEACDNVSKRRYSKRCKPILNDICVNDNITGMTVFPCRPATCVAKCCINNSVSIINYEKEESTSKFYGLNENTASLSYDSVKFIDAPHDNKISESVDIDVEKGNGKYLNMPIKEQNFNSCKVSFDSNINQFNKKCDCLIDRSNNNHTKQEVVDEKMNFQTCCNLISVTQSEEINKFHSGNECFGISDNIDSSGIDKPIDSKLNSVGTSISEPCKIENSELSVNDIDGTVDSIFSNENSEYQLNVNEYDTDIENNNLKKFHNNEISPYVLEKHVYKEHTCEDNLQYGKKILVHLTSRINGAECCKIENCIENYDEVNEYGVGCEMVQNQKMLSSDSLNDLCNKKLENVKNNDSFSDDSSYPLEKKRRYNSSDAISDVTEVLFVSSQPEKNSSVLYDHSFGKLSSHNTNFHNNYSGNLDEQTDESNCCTLITNTDIELCEECQRSRSDSDLCCLYNKKLLKCCLDKKNRILVVNEGCVSNYGYDNDDALCTDISDEAINIDHKVRHDSDENKTSITDLKNEALVSEGGSNDSNSSDDWKRKRSFVNQDENPLINDDSGDSYLTDFSPATNNVFKFSGNENKNCIGFYKTNQLLFGDKVKKPYNSFDKKFEYNNCKKNYNSAEMVNEDSIFETEHKIALSDSVIFFQANNKEVKTNLCFDVLLNKTEEDRRESCCTKSKLLVENKLINQENEENCNFTVTKNNINLKNESAGNWESSVFYEQNFQDNEFVNNDKKVYLSPFPSHRKPVTDNEFVIVDDNVCQNEEEGNKNIKFQFLNTANDFNLNDCNKSSNFFDVLKSTKNNNCYYVFQGNNLNSFHSSSELDMVSCIDKNFVTSTNYTEDVCKIVEIADTEQDLESNQYCSFSPIASCNNYISNNKAEVDYEIKKVKNKRDTLVVEGGPIQLNEVEMEEESNYSDSFCQNYIVYDEVSETDNIADVTDNTKIESNQLGLVEVLGKSNLNLYESFEDECTRNTNLIDEKSLIGNNHEQSPSYSNEVQYEQCKDNLLCSLGIDGFNYRLANSHLHVEDDTVLNTKNFSQVSSNSTYIKHCLTEKSCVSYSSKVSFVKRHTWQEISDNSEDYSKKVLEKPVKSFLPPIKSKPHKKPLLDSSKILEVNNFCSRSNNVCNKLINIDDNKVRKKSKIPKLTNWQLVAEKCGTLPALAVGNSPVKKMFKEEKAEPLKLPSLTCKRNMYTQLCIQQGFKNHWVVLPRVVKHVVTAILPKRFPVVSLDNYDPYKSAERQMKELLGIDDEARTEFPYLAEESGKKEQIISISPIDNISSPVSAFAKFTPIQSPIPTENIENCIPPPLKFDDSIPNSSPIIIEGNNFEKFRRASLASGESDFLKDKNQNPISLSSLSLCSTISIDSIDSYKSSFRKGVSTSAKAQSYDKRAELSLKRSISAVDSHHRKGRDFLRGNLKMEDLLYGISNNNNYDRFLETPVDDISRNKNCSFENLTLSSESLIKSDSVDDRSKAEQELLKSMSEFEKLFESPTLKSIPPLVPSLSPVPVPKSSTNSVTTESCNQQQVNGNKICSDSAYNSLNRKSPQLEDSSTIENCSSSGSECSFPALKGQNSQAARFCHECGSKYPVVAAKFCCQCGVKRLII